MPLPVIEPRGGPDPHVIEDLKRAIVAADGREFHHWDENESRLDLDYCERCGYVKHLFVRDPEIVIFDVVLSNGRSVKVHATYIVRRCLSCG